MNIINILIPVFLVLALGALSIKMKIFKSEDSYIFSKYDFYIGFPILIFYTLSHTEFSSISNMPFLGTNLIALIIAVILVILVSYVLRLPRKLTGILILGGIYGNVAYMGIPVNELLFGKEGTGYASVIVGVVSVFALSVGIMAIELFSNKKPKVYEILKSMIKNPIIIAVVLGVIVSALKITFPAPIEKFLDIVSKSASPIALFAIGMFLIRKNSFKNIGMIITLCIFNLLVLPLLVFLLAPLMGLTGLPLNVSLISAAMPLAATNFVLAQKYKLGEEIISSAIIISTVLSVLTLACLLAFIA
jgi:malonate transporter and related proteins